MPLAFSSKRCSTCSLSLYLMQPFFFPFKHTKFWWHNLPPADGNHDQSAPTIDIIPRLFSNPSDAFFKLIISSNILPFSVLKSHLVTRRLQSHSKAQNEGRTEEQADENINIHSFVWKTSHCTFSLHRQTAERWQLSFSSLISPLSTEWILQ